MVSCWRFELQTLWLKVKCSTDWANETNIIIKMAASGGFEPPECQSQSLMPCHLATRQYLKWWKEMDLNHRTRRNRFTVCRVWPLRYPSVIKKVLFFLQRQYRFYHIFLRLWTLFLKFVKKIAFFLFFKGFYAYFL